MATLALVQALPRLASGATIAVRIAGGGANPYVGHLGYNDWRAGVMREPRFTGLIPFEQSGFTGGGVPQTSSLLIGSDNADYMSALSNLYWPGARIIVDVCDDEVAPVVYERRLTGTVSARSFSANRLTLTIADLSADLNKPVAPNSFAGTGDLEGSEEVAGRAKRRTFGAAYNIEGRLLDKVNNVYEFGDPAYPWPAFLAVKDKGVAGGIAAIGWQGSALATLNALRASAPAQGGAVVAPSIACAKWWTTPAGPLTADILGEMPAANQYRAPQLATYLVGQATAAASIAPYDANWSPGAAGVHVDGASETFAQLLDRLLLPVSIVWVMDGAGAFTMLPIRWDGPAASLTAQTVEREETFKPLRTRRLGFQANNRIHTDAEIAAVLAESTNPTYSDGTPIDVLRPAEAGANVTENRTAAAINGQGDLALKDYTQFGPSGTVRTETGTTATDATVVTSEGQAAAIAGQGDLATLDQAAYDQIALATLRKDASANDPGSYTAGNVDQVVQVAGINLAIPVRATGDLYVSINSFVTLGPIPSNYNDGGGSSAYGTITFPDGSTAPINLSTGLVKADYSSKSAGTCTLKVYAKRGPFDQPPANGEPGIRSRAVTISNVTASLTWKAI